MPTRNEGQTQLSHEEHLILIGFVAKAKLDLAIKAFEREFRDPIVRWLNDQPDCKATVIGRVKAYLAKVLPKPIPNLEALKTDLIGAVRDNGIQLNELLQLIETGIIGITKPAEMIELLSSRLSHPQARYMVQPANPDIPTSTRLHLRGANSGALDELSATFRRLDSITRVVEESSRRRIAPAVINRLRS